VNLNLILPVRCPQRSPSTVERPKCAPKEKAGGQSTWFAFPALAGESRQVAQLRLRGAVRARLCRNRLARRRKSRRRIETSRPWHSDLGIFTRWPWSRYEFGHARVEWWSFAAPSPRQL